MCGAQVITGGKVQLLIPMSTHVEAGIVVI